jgi:hypothetical protein
MAPFTDSLARPAVQILGDEVAHFGHRDAIHHWGEALARGDGAGVERWVRQSRIDIVWLAASGQLGAMLG